MMKGHFHNALNNLQSMLGSMAAYAEEAVQLSGKAVEEVSLEKAASVIAGDEKIDTMEIEIEEECLKILALHQPVASDLRQVITILKVNSELERIGDLAVNMAERVGNIDSFKNHRIEKFDFGDMLHIACGMLKDALDSLSYTLDALAKLGFEKSQVYTTMELRMKCGIGKCGRCNIGNKYVCKDGPVFRFDELDALPDEY